MSLYRRLLEFVKPYWFKLILAVICMVAVSFLTAATAWLFKPVVDGVFFRKEGMSSLTIPPFVNHIIVYLHLEGLLLQRGMEMLRLLPILLILLYLLKGIFNYGQAYFMNFVGLRIIADVREKLYNHLQTLSLSFFTKTPTGIIISRITNDVTLIQGAVSSTTAGVFKDIFTFFGLVSVAFLQSWKLAVIAYIIFPLAIIPIRGFGKKMRKFARRGQQRMGLLTTFLHETITGNRIVKAFNMEEYEKRRFTEENDRLFKTFLKRIKVRALNTPLMEFLGGIAAAIIIWVGGNMVMRGELTPGTFGSFLLAVFMCYAPIRDLSKVNLEIQEGLAGAARIFELLDTTTDVEDAEDAVLLPPITQGIDFQKVTFKYEDDVVLKDISLRVKVGEVIALVGMSGAGKTSLVNLLPRFYDVEQGEILIDGCNIRKATLKSLRDQIGLVTQQTILFNDTARNNIAYGNLKCSEQEVIQAAEAANAHDFIQRLPQGYDTNIGEQGVKLSGGERQRISIARALLKNAPILILDEATSSLDSDSETEVQRALEELMKGRTVFVIAHRLSTIRNAHRIVVLSEGQIVEQGTHEELMACNGEYCRLYNLQFRDDGTRIQTVPKAQKVY
ncbi:MAG TPA: ABC transporter ATP-binding protein [Thermodesulfobacteriota bacterium]|jgi:subfamily B ATP-binding cassette protein MsbA|nr:ABC transporter ATP-binding protein [Thermodesulfobacteriota bacterium]